MKATKSETFTAADIAGVSALEISDRNNKPRKPKGAAKVASIKAKAERNKIISAALAADPKRAKSIAKGKKVAAEVVKATTKPKKAPARVKSGTSGLGIHDAAVTLGEMVKLDQIPRLSTVKSPCQIVWETASEMQKKGGFTRKDVLAACMEKGVAYYTARTQYQQWKAAGDNDKKAAAKHPKL